MAESRLRSFQVRDRVGRVVHEGEATSLRRFVEALVERKVSFAGCDLRGFPLNHLEIDGLDFSGCDATGAALVGASACGANWSGAILRSVKADGLRARNARLCGADLGPDAEEGPSRFRGADFSGADLRAAILDEADMTEAAFMAANMSWCRARATVFKGASLVNAEHADASYHRCDFTDADLSAHVGEGVEALACRTERASVVDCVYAGTTIGDGALAFRSDANTGTLVRAVGLGVSALAVAVAAKWIPEEAGLGFTQGLLGHGAMLVAAVGVANWLREFLEEKTKEHLGRGVSAALRKATQFIASASRSGIRVGRLCAVMADDRTRRVMSAAFDATTRDAAAMGVMETIGEVTVGGTEVVLCDRRRLALALAHMHAERTNGVRLTSDLVLIRDCEGAGDAPVGLRFCVDGGLTAVWRGEGGRLRSVSWDRSGNVHGTQGFWGDVPDPDRAKAAFEDALWRDHGERRPYLSQAHRLVAGRDGSIQILHRKTGRLNNPWGFAYLGVGGDMRVYRYGSHEGYLIDGDDIVEGAAPAASP